MTRLYERFVPHRWQWPWRRFQCGQPNPHDHGMGIGNPCLRRAGTVTCGQSAGNNNTVAGVEGSMTTNKDAAENTVGVLADARRRQRELDAAQQEWHDALAALTEAKHRYRAACIALLRKVKEGQQ